MKAARIVKGLSAAEVACVLACSPAVYRRLECGREAVAPEQARRLAQYYGLPAFYFMQAAGPLVFQERIARLRAELSSIPTDLRGKVEHLALVEERQSLLQELLTAQEQLLAILISS